MVNSISAADQYSVNPFTDTIVGAATVLSSLFKCLISDPLSSVYFIPKKIQELEHDITVIKGSLELDMEKDKVAIGQLQEKILERDRLSLEGAGFKEHVKDIGRGLFRMLPVIYTIYCAIMWDRCNRAEKYLECATKEKDSANAMEFYKRAAELGNASAQFKVASHYYTKQKTEIAIKYIDKAAKQGHSMALHARGEIYDKMKDYQKAFSSYLKAAIADKNNAISLVNLSRMYAGEEDIKQDDEKAFEYALVAAQMGNVHAYRDLGLMYQNGIGVKQNLDKAAFYLSKAPLKNVPGAVADLDKAPQTQRQEEAGKKENWHYGSMGANFDQLTKLYT